MDFNYTNIVTAIDGSEASEKAFKKAVKIAKDNNSRLVIAHVVDSRTFVAAETYDRTIRERAEQYANELIEEHVKHAEENGVKDVVYSIEFGSPKVKIAKDIANNYQADLIVCGATGMNAVERFLMGSVSEGISRYATCDVLVVR